MVVQPSPSIRRQNAATPEKVGDSAPPPAVADTFRPELIRQTLERFLKQPDVAKPNLRRSIDARDTALLEDWFFSKVDAAPSPAAAPGHATSW